MHAVPRSQSSDLHRYMLGTPFDLPLAIKMRADHYALTVTRIPLRLLGHLTNHFSSGTDFLAPTDRPGASITSRDGN